MGVTNFLTWLGGVCRYFSELKDAIDTSPSPASTSSEPSMTARTKPSGRLSNTSSFDQLLNFITNPFKTTKVAPVLIDEPIILSGNRNAGQVIQSEMVHSVVSTHSISGQMSVSNNSSHEEVYEPVDRIPDLPAVSEAVPQIRNTSLTIRSTMGLTLMLDI